jgi:hypothetical protein
MLHDGPGELSRYSDSLRTWTVGDRIPVGGADFQRPSILVLGQTQPPIQWVPGLFPSGKAAGRGVEHPSHLATRLKKE